jgi:hypothetical protein
VRLKYFDWTIGSDRTARADFLQLEPERHSLCASTLLLRRVTSVNIPDGGIGAGVLRSLFAIYWTVPSFSGIQFLRHEIVLVSDRMIF